MPATFVRSLAGEEIVNRGIANGINDFAARVRDEVRAVTAQVMVRYSTGFHTRGKGRPPRIGHYRDTIYFVTYLNGQRFDGEEAKATGFSPNPTRNVPVKAMVYSDSSLAHMLELTGARPHDIPIGSPFGSPAGPFHGTFIVKHPGFTRRPHFVPGLFAVAGEVPSHMAGKF